VPLADLQRRALDQTATGRTMLLTPGSRGQRSVANRTGPSWRSPLPYSSELDGPALPPSSAAVVMIARQLEIVGCLR